MHTQRRVQPLELHYHYSVCAQGTEAVGHPGPLLAAWALLLGQLLSLDTLDGERRAIATALREDTR